MTLIIPPATATSCPLPPHHETIHLLDPRPELAGDRRTDDFPDMKAKRPPTIRRGQFHAYHRGSQREIDERRGYLARMLARGVRKMDIHAVGRVMFHRQWRTLDRDIAFIVGQASQWRERARTGFCRMSLYDAYKKIGLIKDDTPNDAST